MKINFDCMYDTMSTLEDALAIKAINGTYFFEPMSLERLVNIMHKKRSQYMEFDVVYTVIQLVEGGYIATTNQSIVGNRHGEIDIGRILFITPKGHEFMEDHKRQRTAR